MTAPAINTQILSLLNNGMSPVNAGELTRIVDQGVDLEGFSRILQSLDSQPMVERAVPTLLQESLSEQLSALPPEMLEQLKAVIDNGNILPQAAEITPMLESATESMSEAIRALDRVTAELDQAITLDDLVASIAAASSRPEQSNRAIDSEDLGPVVETDDTPTALPISDSTQAFSVKPDRADSEEISRVIAALLQAGNHAKSEAAVVELDRVQRSIGQLFPAVDIANERQALPTNAAPAATPVVAPAIQKIIQEMVQQPASAATTQTAPSGKEMSEKLMQAGEMLQQQLRDGQPATDRLNLIAEKMRAVGEATPRLAKEVSTLGQMLAPAMKILAQNQAERVATVPVAMATKPEGASFDSLINGISSASELSSRSVEKLAPSPLPMSYNAKGWDQALGNRVMWMVGNNVQQASIKISPQNLGPIEVQVSMQDDVAKVSMVTHSGVVREALEAAIPRLREVFSDNNLQLANVDVSQKNPQEQQNLARGSGDGESQRESGAAGDALSGELDEMDDSTNTRVTLSKLGLVDDYA